MARFGRRFPFQPHIAPAQAPPPPSGSDAITITDVAAVRGGVADSITITEQLGPIELRPTDAVTLTDAAGAQRRYATSDSVTFSDDGRASATVGHASDAVSISDSTTRALGSSDSLSISDSAKSRSSTADSVSFSDTAAIRGLHTTLLGSDSLAIGDTAAVTSSHSHLTAADSILLSDVASRVYFASDAVAFSDSGAAGVPFVAGNDSLTLLDLASGVASANRGFLYQAGAEVAFSPTSEARIFQSGAEVALGTTSTLRLSQLGAEVVIGVGSPSPPGSGDLWWLWRRRHYRR